MLREFKVAEDPTDTKPIDATIRKYLELGDVESAYRVAVERGDVSHIVTTGLEIAKIDPQQLIQTITEKYIVQKEKYYWPMPERAVEVYSRIADAMFRTGNFKIGQQFITEAERALEIMAPENIDKKNLFYSSRVDQWKDSARILIPVLAHQDPDQAFALLEKSVSDENDKYDFTRKYKINQIAAITAIYNPSRAWKIYQTTDQDSYGKTRSLIEIVLEYAKREGPEEAQFLFDEIDKFHIEMRFDAITPQDLVELSEFFPAWKNWLHFQFQIRRRRIIRHFTTKRIYHF